MRYHVRFRSLEKGWIVWDTVKNTPAVVKGVWQIGLPMKTAEALTNWLNRWDPAVAKDDSTPGE